LFADYASNERARMHANPKLQVNIVIATKFTKGFCIPKAKSAMFSA